MFIDKLNASKPPVDITNPHGVALNRDADPITVTPTTVAAGPGIKAGAALLGSALIGANVGDLGD